MSTFLIITGAFWFGGVCGIGFAYLCVRRAMRDSHKQWDSGFLPAVRVGETAERARIVHYLRACGGPSRITKAVAEELAQAIETGEHETWMTPTLPNKGVQ